MKKFFKTLFAIMITLSISYNSAFADIKCTAKSNFEIDLERIITEYSNLYPKYIDEITARVRNYEVQISFEDYYNENPQDALDTIYESLDYYISYKENNINSNIDNNSNISLFAADTSSSYARYYVDCPTENIMQENGYYCGPACVYITIEGIRNHVPSAIKSGITNSQTQNALAMNTTSAHGTSEGNMRTRLSSMLNGRKYCMDYMANFTRTEFISYVENSLNNDNPVILMITSPFLSYYPDSYLNNSAYNSSNHYVVISEVIYVNHSYYFTIVDPNNYNNGSLCGEHSITASDAYENTIAMLWGKNQ